MSSLETLTQLFPRRSVSAKPSLRDSGYKDRHAAYMRQHRQVPSVRTARLERQRIERKLSISSAKYHKHLWTRKELSTLVLPLTCREIAVLLARSETAVTQKALELKVILAYREGRLKLNGKHRRILLRVKRWETLAEKRGRFSKNNIKWLIEHYELKHATFRPYDHAGTGISTIVNRGRRESSSRPNKVR